jgi:hypothetical protein
MTGERGCKWTCGFSSTTSAWTSTGSIIGERGSKWTTGCCSSSVFSGVIDLSYSSADFA